MIKKNIQLSSRIIFEFERTAKLTILKKYYDIIITSIYFYVNFVIAVWTGKYPLSFMNLS
jgi:hypothetical protein